jgi:thiol-disulfide isomerase/thioredoxin
LFYFICVQQIYSQAEKDRFDLSGIIKGQKKGIISLSYRTIGGKQKIDSCKLKNGKFHFTGHLNIASRAFLRGDVKSNDDSDLNNSGGFFIEPSVIKVALSYNNFKQLKISGCKTQIESEELSNKISLIKDTGKIYLEKKDRLIQDFIRQHPNSFKSVFNLFVDKYRWPFETVKSLYYIIDPKLLVTPEGSSLSQFIKKTEENSVGKLAKSFVTSDYKENMISLSDFNEKYILIDFWASWCIPCREVNPHLIDIYSKFHSKGLEILSVSVDRDKSSWLKAIEEDKIGIWHHILSKMEGGIYINEIYGVSYYPTKILVGRDYRIIGRFSGTDDEILLDKKLAEIF